MTGGEWAWDCEAPGDTLAAVSAEGGHAVRGDCEPGVGLASKSVFVCAFPKPGRGVDDEAWG
jgi:hypothetical protein